MFCSCFLLNLVFLALEQEKWSDLACKIFSIQNIPGKNLRNLLINVRGCTEQTQGFSWLFVQCEGRWKHYRNLLQMAVEWTGEDHMEVHTRRRWSSELVYEMLAILDVSTAVVS